MFATNTAPSRNDLAKVRKIVMQSKHLQPVIDFLASFCCEGGYILVEYYVPYNDPFDPHYVGRCLQDAYDAAGGSDDTRPHVFFEAVKLRFGDLPAFYELFQKFMIEVVEGIRAKHPHWNVLAMEEQAWLAQSRRVGISVRLGRLGKLIRHVFTLALAEKAPRAVRTDT